LPSIVGAPAILLELVDERFYHLDTAVAPLDETTCLAVREAFTDESWSSLERVFARIGVVDVDEAAAAFACNAHCPDRKNVVIEPAAREASKLLSRLGFGVVGVDLSEFRKSGGSVFCMKMMLP
jgi:N-dimethylarginine dimethylaminohydrolase